MGARPLFLQEVCMKYYVIENDEVFDNYEDAVDSCIDEDYHSDDDYFEEWVNDTYGSIEIGGDTFWAYDIIYQMGDESYLRDSFCEAQNESDRDEAIWSLRRGDIGDEVECQNCTIRIIEDDEEEREPFVSFNDNDDSVGDIDGDNIIDVCRQKIEAEKLRLQQVHAAEKTAEDDYMKMFQTLGD